MKSDAIAGIVRRAHRACLAGVVVRHAGADARARRAGGGEATRRSDPLELERWFDSYVLLQAQETLQADRRAVRALPAAAEGAAGGATPARQTRRQILNGFGAI